MTTIFDVAKYILEVKGPMSTLKLQKLCYYSQAWSLAWTEQPLFSEQIEAWANGPVCPDLFKEHKGHFMITSDNLHRGDSNNLSSDQKDSIEKVLEYYGDWAPYELREQTHSEDPWKIARRNIADGEPCSNVISLESIGNYYGNL